LLAHTHLTSRANATTTASHVCSDSLASLPVLETLELTSENVELVLDEVRTLVFSLLASTTAPALARSC
jgi:hypothetical protein